MTPIVAEICRGGGALADLSMSAPGEAPATLSFAQEDLRNWLGSLSSLRARFATLTRGEWQTIWVWDNVYVYTRYGIGHSGVAELSVIAMSQSESEHTLEIPIPDPLRAALSSPRSLGSEPDLGAGQLSPNAENNMFTLTLPAGEASVWVWTGE